MPEVGLVCINSLNTLKRKSNPIIILEIHIKIEKTSQDYTNRVFILYELVSTVNV